MPPDLADDGQPRRVPEPAFRLPPSRLPPLCLPPFTAPPSGRGRRHVPTGPLTGMPALVIASGLLVLAGAAAAIGGLMGWTMALGSFGGWLLAALVLASSGLLFGLVLVLRRDLALAVTRIGQLSHDGALPPDDVGPDDEQPWLLAPVDDALRRVSRRLAEQAASASRRQRTDAMIFNLLPDPLIVLDLNREVLRFNPAAERSFGRDLPAVLRHPALRSAIDRAVAGEGGDPVEVSLSVPVPREVQATVILLDATPPEPIRVAVVLSDRTRDRAVERMRADFVANVSHELRTPLTSLIGFTETLRGPAADDPPARAQFLAIMAEQGARMTRLIDDLLSLSRIELVEHQPPTQPMDLDDLARHVLTFYPPRLAERSASIETEIEADLPMVYGDSDQLVQVLQNLLDNALKYGRAGGTIRLSIGRSAAAAAPGPDAAPAWPRAGVVIAVADDGIGIPAHHVPRLTERFYRVDRARSRSAGGTGLGLAIVKHIVNRHRGRLRIDSTEGVGTTVSLWLPTPETADPGD